MSLAFDLFSPFIVSGRVDERLLQALGIAATDEYSGELDKVVDPSEGTRFDLYLEGKSGRRIFFDVKLSETRFGAREDDAAQRASFERHCRAHLEEHVDAKWLAPPACFDNHELLRKVSYLGRYPDSGLAFIFPRADASLREAEKTIKQIVSKTLAPRVAIFYLEYLVERILTAVEGDPDLRKHFLRVRDEYILSTIVLKSPSAP